MAALPQSNRCGSVPAEAPPQAAPVARRAVSPTGRVTAADGGRVGVPGFSHGASRLLPAVARTVPPARHDAAPGDLAMLIERNRVPLCRDPAVQADLRAGALAAIRRARPGARGSPPRLAYLVAGLCWGELCKYLDVFAAGGDWSGRSGALSLRPLASVIGRPIHLHQHDRATGRWVRSGVIVPVFPDVEVAGDRPPIQLSVRDGGYQPRHAPTPTGPAGVGGHRVRRGRRCDRLARRCRRRRSVAPPGRLLSGRQPGAAGPRRDLPAAAAGRPAAGKSGQSHRPAVGRVSRLRRAGRCLAASPGGRRRTFFYFTITGRRPHIAR